MPPFADRLAAAVRRTRTAALVGLDPRWEQLPEPLRAGRNPQQHEVVADALCQFCCEVLDVVADLVPAVKPQAAFFERLGPPGMQALAAVIQSARRRGLLVILDGKRNDIGSTAAGYADAYLGVESAWQADALTVSPYLGEDSLTPFIEVAWQRDAGVFVLVKTSNPGGSRYQDLLCQGKPLYRHIAEDVQRWAAQHPTACGYGAVGAVVGATYPEQLAELREAMPQAWLLVPGFGAQGGEAADVAAAFDAQGLGALINSSRAIIYAHARDEFRTAADAAWQQAVEAATRQMIDQLRAHTPAAGLAGQA
jgi:orotidine-5'-phosphate decarboxylase